VQAVALQPGRADVMVTTVSEVAAVADTHDAGTTTHMVQTRDRPADGLFAGDDASLRASGPSTLPDRADLSGLSNTYPALLSSAPQAPSGNRLRQSTRIPLAEDNAINSMIATRYLRNLGYPDVVAVADGQAAVAAVSNSSFHLVLMDCQMPVMDGYEATRRIRALPDPDKRTVPIIALTASALQADVDRCMAAGMDDHLSKPYLARDLALKLNVLLPPAARCSVPPAGLVRSRSQTSSSSSSSASAVEMSATPPSADMTADVLHGANLTGTAPAAQSDPRLWPLAVGQ
jgi:CheY-like chemotaxis protein